MNSEHLVIMFDVNNSDLTPEEYFILENIIGYTSNVLIFCMMIPQIYKAYKSGKYEPLNYDILKSHLRWKAVRFGAYGDPAALPLWLINAITKNCKDFTGYTHSWKRFPGLSKYFMASVESYDLKDKAKKLGFRTFRVIPKTEFRNSNRMEKYYREITCPAENKGKQCIDCLLCNGSKQAADITITAHGARAGGFE